VTMRRVVLATCLAAAVTVSGTLVASDNASSAPGSAVPAGSAWDAPLTPPPIAAPAPAPTPPTRLRIPVIGVDAPLEELALDAAGTLGGPVRFADAGWYAAGTVPGEVGPAVIAGHVDSKTGPAVFYRLAQLHSGDVVEVARGGTWLEFRVVGIERYPKNRFPRYRVYGPTPDPQLRLITCGGVFDHARGSYLDNTVVYAVAT